MERLKKPVRTLTFLTCVLAVPTVARILYGVPEWEDRARMAVFLCVGAVLGAAHLLLRPLLRLVTAPIGCVTFGLSGMALDIGLIYLSAACVRNFPAPPFLYALLTALLINAVTAVLRGKK